MEYERLAKIANDNAPYNFGRTFTVDSIRDFLETAFIKEYFHSQDGALYGAITVTSDGEVGFILDPAHTREALPRMCAALDSIEIPLCAIVQNDNKSILRILKEHHFAVEQEGEDFVFLRRGK